MLSAFSPALKVDFKASQTSSMATSPSSIRSARRRKVVMSSLRSSSTALGRPAMSRPIGAPSRMRCCTSADRARSSSRGMACTSSIVSSRPVPCSASHWVSARAFCRQEGSGVGACSSVALPPPSGVLRLKEVNRERSLPASCDSWRVNSAASRSMSPSRAVSSTTTQPRSRAESPRAVSMTVFPTPLAPVMSSKSPGAPGPSSRLSRNSSMTRLRPTSNGGVAPAVGLKGLAMCDRLHFCAF